MEKSAQIQTKRAILKFLASIYDPLGITAPYEIKLELLMRETLHQQDRSNFNTKELWNSPIVQNFIPKWASLIQE